MSLPTQLPGSSGRRRKTDLHQDFNRFFFYHYAKTVHTFVERRPASQEGFSLFLDDTDS
jgi:hypothetical protein